ncbi:hypothetical protein QTP86_030979 [Hemibagrus guttatus]|nr:hypothetical protein QTP86_030979 [Hemibagrus guttatus]
MTDRTVCLDLLRYRSHNLTSVHTFCLSAVMIPHIRQAAEFRAGSEQEFPSVLYTRVHQAATAGPLSKVLILQLLSCINEIKNYAMAAPSPAKSIGDPGITPLSPTHTMKDSEQNEPASHSFVVVVAIDFGTTSSGYAYAFTKEAECIHTMRRWEGGDPGVSNQKTPTTILLTPDRKFHSFGYAARDFYHDLDPTESKQWLYLEKFKMKLHTTAVGCELEEKERFWSELDEVMESIPTGERVVIGADLNGHVGEGNRGDEEVMGKFGVKERNLEGQMVVDFAKRMDMAVVSTYFQKREEHRVTYMSGGRRTQKKKEECCEEFRQKLRQALGGQVVLPDDWETTAEVIRETGRKVLGVSSGRRKEDKETWWWNEEVQDSIHRKRLAKKKWDMDRTEENRQEYKELQRRVKREVSKAKQKAYDELYTRLDTREGEKDLYRLARQRDRDGKDVQQVRVIKDRDGRVLTSEESVQRRWKEYFEELMNEENEREKRVEGVNSVEQEVDKIRKDEVRKALKRMKSGKAVGPDDIPVEVWKCLGEAAVEFLTSLFNRVLENLEKAYDRVPREELWYCMRKSGVAEKYVRVVQDMYERSRTVVRCAVGQTEEFNVEVGLHQGSALSPFLFAIVMDRLSEEVRQESPWTMMFADDIVICSESREQVEENLERWRFALERRGMKVSRSKTEYMCVNEREGSGTVRLQGEEVKKVQEFKYLGSTVHSNGECGKEVKKRVQAGWNGWRKVSGVLCDRKISARIKGKVYRTVVRPAMLYGLETVSLRKRQESELENLSIDTDLHAANGKKVKALDIFAYALAFFKEQALKELSDQAGVEFDNADVRWVITVPAIWKMPAKQFMREAAYKAGLALRENPEQLIISLEPEAASIYCRKLRLHQMVDLGDKTSINGYNSTENVGAGMAQAKEHVRRNRQSRTFLVENVVGELWSELSEGDRYVVVDCGGGTVDLTVHQIRMPEGHLKELYKASGGPYGSIGVDYEFEKLLCKIFGQDFIDQFKIKRPAAWVDLMIAFESRKRAAAPDRSNPLNINLPFSFIDYYKKYRGHSVEHALRKSNVDFVKWSSQGMLRMSPDAMNALFKPTIEHIIQHLKELFEKPEVTDIKFLFLVGGFAESPLLQKAVQDMLQGRSRVIIPHDVGLTILKGAVLFGLDPGVIKVRRSPLTYGVGVLNRFVEGKHPPEKLLVRDGTRWCTDVFDTFISADQSVALGETVKRSYTPAKPSQQVIVIHVYCSEREHVGFISDAGVRKCGTLRLDVSGTESPAAGVRREIQTLMQFGDTEIRAMAIDVATNRMVKASIDFLGQ